MELNREQIIKALECCALGEPCNKCAYRQKSKDTYGCRKTWMTDALSLIKELTDENEKLKAMVDMWKSTAYCEKDRLSNIKADTIHKMKRDLNVEFLYLARCQKNDEPNMKSQEVFEALDRVTKRHLDVSGNDNRCVACGEILPEGRQVCPQCEQKTNKKEVNKN